MSYLWMVPNRLEKSPLYCGLHEDYYIDDELIFSLRPRNHGFLYKKYAGHEPGEFTWIMINDKIRIYFGKSGTTMMLYYTENTFEFPLNIFKREFVFKIHNLPVLYITSFEKHIHDEEIKANGCRFSDIMKKYCFQDYIEGEFSCYINQNKLHIELFIISHGRRSFIFDSYIILIYSNYNPECFIIPGFIWDKQKCIVAKKNPITRRLKLDYDTYLSYFGSNGLYFKFRASMNNLTRTSWTTVISYEVDLKYKLNQVHDELFYKPESANFEGGIKYQELKTLI